MYGSDEIFGSPKKNLIKPIFEKLIFWKHVPDQNFCCLKFFSLCPLTQIFQVYGFQWRHWGAKYVDHKTDYTNQGIDQLAECINKIKNNPTDRRIILSAWNVSDLDQMALPPCHSFCQFFVSLKKRELSCHMYQRSCDVGLGVPFNIASYALLTIMIAHVCDLNPGELIYSMGDTHVYTNHIDALKQQLERTPKEFPTLKIRRNMESINDFSFDDFELVGYNPHKPIKMDMAV
jgi:thymidylate synthase